MAATVHGLHHVTAISGDAQENLNFYAGVLGLRLVKRSVNQDAPDTYHFFYADADGTPAPSRTQSVDSGLCPFAAAGAAALAAADPRGLVGEAEYASVTYTLAVAVFAETPKPGAASARGHPPSALI